MLHDVVRDYSSDELSPLCNKFVLFIALVFLLAMHIPILNLSQLDLDNSLALSSNICTWIAFSAVLAIGCYQIAQQGKFIYSSFTLALLICCILLTIPIFYSDANWHLSYQRIAGLWAGMGFFFILQQFDLKHNKQVFLWIVLLAVLIQTAFGYLQYFYPNNNQLLSLTAYSQPLGIFQQPNVMLSFLATGLAISGYLFPFQTHSLARFILLIIPAITLPLIIVLAAYSSYSIALITFILVFLSLRKRLTKREFHTWLLSVVLGLLSAGLLLTTPNNGKQELQAIELQQEEIKALTFPQSVDMWLAKPWLGYGYGRFESKYLAFSAKKHTQDLSYFVTNASITHPYNETLFWLVEGGVLPLISILLLVSAAMFLIINTEKISRLAIIAMFVPIILNSQLEYPFHSSFVHWLIFIILLWWVDRHSITSIKKLSLSTRTAFKISSIVLPSLVVIFMFFALQTIYLFCEYKKEQTADISILNKIIMPVILQDEINQKIYTSYLNYGIKTHQPRLIKLYIQWANQIVKLKPRKEYYLGLIQAYRVLGNEKNARLVIAQANYHFPNVYFE